MKWIWMKEAFAPSFAEFKLPFVYEGGALTLKISAEYRYIAYLNGKFVANGQYPDIPAYKVYDEVDIASFVQAGENELVVHAFHMGLDGMTVRADIPCVAFQIKQGERVLAESDENTLCRPLAAYSAGAMTTPQLGLGFTYDFTAQPLPWEKALEKQVGYNEVPRPVLKTKVEKKLSGVVTAQGVYLKNGGETDAEILQNCWMKTVLFDELANCPREKNYALKSPVTFASKEGDGIFVIVDLGAESVGFPSFSISVKKSCKARLCWGEHLKDLRIRANIGPRHFAYGFTLNEGENKFTEYFRRIGCRYLGFYAECDELTVTEIGLIEDEYPLALPKKDFGDRLLNKIYETGRRTLQLCMHDHYEDCPWREQALYTGDSRNQMKFGYGAFGEKTMARESLRFMGLCIEEDGLIPITAPARVDLNIPAGSFYWTVGVYEYLLEDFDEEFLKECLPVAERISAAYEARTTNQGIMTFGEARYWNFHEWSDGLDGPCNGQIWRTEDIPPEADGLLTAIGVFATKRLAVLCEWANEPKKAAYYRDYAARLEKALEGFYCAEKGLYRSYLGGEKYHAYTQAMALASGAVKDEERIKYICKVLRKPEKYGVVEMTLAYFPLKYDVLIEYDDGLEFVIEQICEVFGGMLFEGATSYWETALGEMDFTSAGSLCHGWASVACYILDKYYQPLRKKKSIRCTLTKKIKK
jgi:hypothetical protein